MSILDEGRSLVNPCRDIEVGGRWNGTDDEPNIQEMNFLSNLRNAISNNGH